jgi:hypothetical protein
MIFVATKKVEKKKIFTLLFCCCFWIRDLYGHLIHSKNFGLNMDIVDPDAFRWGCGSGIMIYCGPDQDSTSQVVASRI